MCGTSLAAYYCGICHLFDDDPKHDIYHCPFCNICRCVHLLSGACVHLLSGIARLSSLNIFITGIAYKIAHWFI